MTQQIINTGVGADTVKAAFIKANDNYNELYPLLDTSEYTTYLARVVADGGSAQSDYNTRLILRGLKVIHGSLTNHKVLLFAEGGHKTRVSGLYQYISKWYDGTVNNNDSVQATEVSQPYKSGIIAPNEKICIQQPYLSGRRMTFTTPKTFINTDSWTFSWMGMWDGSIAESSNSLIGKGSNTLSNIKFKSVLINRFGFTNESGTTVNGSSGGTNSLIGKYAKVDFVAAGDGTLKIYKNGVFFETLTVETGFVFSQILSGLATTGMGTNGRHVFYGLKAGVSTATQLANEFALFMTQYVELENVLIGSKYITSSNCDMVNTPIGTPINNVIDNANIEKITTAADREFSSDTGWWTAGTGTITISGGTANFNGITNASLFRTMTIISGTWYKFTYTITSISQGGFSARLAGDKNGTAKTSIGTYTDYIQASSTATGIGFIGLDNVIGSIDNVSVQQVGWSDLTNPYNYTYAATAGTAGQKELAACIAAAAWCYHTSSLGISGKIYNEYAKRLFVLDIATAATWGWHVETEAENTVLAALGGNALKKEGTDYWATTGGTNISGYSATAISSGRNADGTFKTTKETVSYWCADSAKALLLHHDSNLAEIVAAAPLEGHHIRFVKN